MVNGLSSSRFKGYSYLRKTYYLYLVFRISSGAEPLVVRSNNPPGYILFPPSTRSLVSWTKQENLNLSAGIIHAALLVVNNPHDWVLLRYIYFSVYHTGGRVHLTRSIDPKHDPESPQCLSYYQKV